MAITGDITYTKITITTAVNNKTYTEEVTGFLKVKDVKGTVYDAPSVLEQINRSNNMLQLTDLHNKFVY
jgi:hypothetical protein